MKEFIVKVEIKALFTERFVFENVDITANPAEILFPAIVEMLVFTARNRPEEILFAFILLITAISA